MAKEYIERESAIEAIAQRYEDIGDDMRAVSIRSKASVLRGIPTADVVSRDTYNEVLCQNNAMKEQLAKIGKSVGSEMDDVRTVVLCRDCASRERKPEDSERTYHWCKMNLRSVMLDDYCSFGSTCDDKTEDS